MLLKEHSDIEFRNELFLQIDLICNKQFVFASPQ